jgi:hypothetical protein
MISRRRAGRTAVVRHWRWLALAAFLALGDLARRGFRIVTVGELLRLSNQK